MRMQGSNSAQLPELQSQVPAILAQLDALEHSVRLTNLDRCELFVVDVRAGVKILLGAQNVDDLQESAATRNVQRRVAFVALRGSEDLSAEAVEKALGGRLVAAEHCHVQRRVARLRVWDVGRHTQPRQSLDLGAVPLIRGRVERRHLYHRF